MQQTPAHHAPNPDLLAILPEARRLVEVGCSYGSLARAYREAHPECHYIGIEIDQAYGAVAADHCDAVHIGDIQSLLSNPNLLSVLHGDCWIFGDTLEHTQDPWQVLRCIRKRMPTNGSVCACIPNMQHWSVQLKLNRGTIQYEDSGLLDRTHLRWFSRQTMLQLFKESGFAIELVKPRIFPHPQLQQALEIISWVAGKQGADPQLAMQDSLPLQYVIRARPRAD
jgi:hypothetical protein